MNQSEPEDGWQKKYKVLSYPLGFKLTEEDFQIKTKPGIFTRLRNWWINLPVGTRSVLFGAHCFFIHPFFVAAAWCKLYGFPWDFKLWVAFFVHDLGYWGMPNMDGAEGERHVMFGANLMHRWFDGWIVHEGYHEDWIDITRDFKWYEFCLYHSRHYAKQSCAVPSRLCFADKLAFCYQIKTIYLWMTRLTGELDEYLENAKTWSNGEYIKAPEGINPDVWYDDLCAWVKKWVYEHKDGKADLVTVNRRTSREKY